MIIKKIDKAYYPYLILLLIYVLHSVLWVILREHPLPNKIGLIFVAAFPSMELISTCSDSPDLFVSLYAFVWLTIPFSFVLSLKVKESIFDLISIQSRVFAMGLSLLPIIFFWWSSGALDDCSILFIPLKNDHHLFEGIFSKNYDLAICASFASAVIFFSSYMLFRCAKRFISIGPKNFI